jgi:hypothetical protein
MTSLNSAEHHDIYPISRWRKRAPVVIGVLFLASPWVLCVIISIPAIAFPLGLPTWDSGPPASLEEIEEYVGLTIPDDVSNLRHDSAMRRGGFMSFSFSAAPEVMGPFVQGICDGVLHPGYNPFEAVDTEDSFDRSVLIEIRTESPRSYYSYSPDAPLTMFGNRCWHEALGMIDILVDTSDPNLYSLSYKRSFGVRIDLQPIYPTAKPAWMPPDYPGPLTFDEWHTAIPRPELTARPGE